AAAPRLDRRNRLSYLAPFSGDWGCFWEFFWWAPPLGWFVLKTEQIPGVITKTPTYCRVAGRKQLFVTVRRALGAVSTLLSREPPWLESRPGCPTFLA